jgi:hypothetical protein
MIRRLVFATLLAGTGCIPIDGGTPPCDAKGGCLPSFKCDRGYCVEDDSAPALPGIGPEGGEVHAGDGIALVVPPGAIMEPVTVEIALGSTHAAIEGVELLSDPWVIQPADIELMAPATVMIPIPPLPEEPLENIGIYRAAMGSFQWERLEGAGEYRMAVAQTMRLGVFAAARPRRAR